jgi:hypothetical protein
LQAMSSSATIIFSATSLLTRRSSQNSNIPTHCLACPAESVDLPPLG